MYLLRGRNKWKILLYLEDLLSTNLSNSK